MSVPIFDFLWIVIFNLILTTCSPEWHDAVSSLYDSVLNTDIFLWVGFQKLRSGKREEDREIAFLTIIKYKAPNFLKRIF